MQARWLVPGIVAALAAAASANGGPVEWSVASGTGGLAPVEVEVALLAEDLRIAIAGDGRHFDVVARYELSNPGRARRVTFGVPVSWTLHEPFAEAEVTPATRSPHARAMARTISVTTGGRRRGCRLTDTPAPAGTRADAGSLTRAAWCTTALTIAAGRSTVVLRYRGELDFSDSEVSKSPLISRHLRTLYYPLYPASGWKGPTRLDVEVDLGPLAGLVVDALPAGATTRGRTLTWSFPRVEVGETPELVVAFDPGPFFLPLDIARWNRGASYYKVAARRASSTLAGGSYGAARAVDGDPATAWCEGDAGDGVGAWIEVEVRGKPDDLAGCRPYAPGAITGYAKSAAVFEANGRLKRVRFGVCGSTAGYEEAVPTASAFDRAGFGERTSDPRTEAESDAMHAITDELTRALRESGTMCLRMTIVEVEPGASGDTCVSELAPLINCG